MVPRTSADLHGLCVSYQCVGIMGLPRDIIEDIVYFHRKDTRTLKACSLTCRALFSAVRGLIHGRVRLSKWRNYPPCKLVDRIAAKVLRGTSATDCHEAHRRYLSTTGKYGLLGYTRDFYIDIGQGFPPETLEAYLPHFRYLTQVHTLRISGGFDVARFLPNFERYFSQFVPTLRSLHLPYVMGGVHEVLEFICKFPHLDNLSFSPSASHYVEVPPRVSVDDSPPLRGKLVLRGWASIPARFLLKIPGGLHFRLVNLGGVDKAELDEILFACSSNLEVFCFRPRSRKST